MANINPIKVDKIKALKDTIIVSDMYFGERVSHGGIVLVNDDMKDSGIRARWAKIYAVGPEVADLTVGQWIYISHGRWTRGVKIEDDDGERVIRKVDNKDVLLVSDEEPIDQTLGDKVV